VMRQDCRRGGRAQRRERLGDRTFSYGEMSPWSGD
jgi:hypothetical protein